METRLPRPRKGVHFELCPTSSVSTEAIVLEKKDSGPSWATHPIRRFVAERTSCSINSDDPAIFRCSLTDELNICVKEMGMSCEDLQWLTLEALEHAFNLEKDLKETAEAPRPSPLVEQLVPDERLRALELKKAPDFMYCEVLAVLVLGALLLLSCRHWAFVPAPSSREPPPPDVLKTAATGAAAVAGGMAMASAALAQEGVSLGLSEQDCSADVRLGPVCPASDGLYGFGKAAADGLLGSEGAEYRPLAIEALLRVRLEVCVLESFVYEAVVPFVQRKGLGWILPFHDAWAEFGAWGGTGQTGPGLPAGPEGLGA
eukprot:g8212.t1